MRKDESHLYNHTRVSRVILIILFWRKLCLFASLFLLIFTGHFFDEIHSAVSSDAEFGICWQLLESWASNLEILFWYFFFAFSNAEMRAAFAFFRSLTNSSFWCCCSWHRSLISSRACSKSWTGNRSLMGGFNMDHLDKRYLGLCQVNLYKYYIHVQTNLPTFSIKFPNFYFQIST